MSLPTAIERLNAHLIGFVRAYTFQLARGIEPQLPDGAGAPGHQAALQAARAIVRTARDKLDVRRMLSAMEKHLAGLGRDPSEPFARLLAELGDAGRREAAQAAAEPVAPAQAAPPPVVAAAAVAVAPVAASEPEPEAAPEPAPAPASIAPAAEVETARATASLAPANEAAADVAAEPSEVPAAASTTEGAADEIHRDASHVEP
ncbi:MAG TPA: hypothetical protein PKI03_04365 [Pseudomonadota bacterium]|nr:hypothetical protein [Pseudomonadota bacterium]